MAKVKALLSDKDLSQEQSEKLERVMLGTSGQHADEFTNEYYLIILQIYQTLLAQKV